MGTETRMHPRRSEHARQTCYVAATTTCPHRAVEAKEVGTGAAKRRPAAGMKSQGPIPPASTAMSAPCVETPKK